MPDPGLAADREKFLAFLRRHLIGPAGGAEEVLRDAPSKHYMMGTLFPRGSSTSGVLQEEDEGAEPDSDSQEGVENPVSMAFQRMPASVGISFFVEGKGQLECQVYGCRYVKSTDPDVPRREIWKRTPISEREDPERVVLSPPTKKGKRSTTEKVLTGEGILHALWRPRKTGFLVTVTLMNVKESGNEEYPDPASCLHQVGFSCRPVDGRLGKYPRLDNLSWDEEEEELELQYRDRAVYAIGHGCAADWESVGGKVMSVRTEFLPRVEVPELTAILKKGAGERGWRTLEETLSLQYLANPKLSAAQLKSRLQAFVDLYGDWIRETEKRCRDIPPELAGAGRRILKGMHAAEARMRKGVETLASSKLARKAFASANMAMLMQMIHSGKDLGGGVFCRNERPLKSPEYMSSEFKNLRWRPFQLAFILFACESVIEEGSVDRKTVDLIWFPTGGGKTEAYFALAAMEIFHRRLKFGASGGGTTVIKRYTLRLLTAQQFQRAGFLICACEMLRRAAPEDFGEESVSLGLWVGESVTPNHLSQAVILREKMLEEERPENPFQLQRCPWCGTRIVPEKKEEDLQYYGVRATGADFSLFCPSDDCAFHGKLPISVVDDELFANPPTLLVGTIDKFARLAWDHRSRAFFGGDANRGRRAPSLIIQDELHLISGPLGTLAGLYEAAIDIVIGHSGSLAKIIASTATIRRAKDQAQNLYGRAVQLFPPAGLEAGDSFFARADDSIPGRMYVGALGQGHTPLYSLVLAGAALAQAPLESGLSPVAKDGYWTLVMFHNSRRELGKTMTVAVDDLPARINVIARDQRVMRDIDAVVELSANVPGREIPEVLERMNVSAGSAGAIDILPCTNMLSVGVDVKRLGLMLVNGQPKTSAEYIQASSRVGRDVVPGVVFTLYSGTKPRDRSHYEGFRAYHQALYRSVEPTSITPLALPARERALHAALVIVARHAGGLQEDADAGRFDPDIEPLRGLIERLKQRISEAEEREAKAARNHLDDLVGQWVGAVERSAASGGSPLHYDAARVGSQFSSLLCSFERPDQGVWPTLNSMRNVDPECLIRVLGER